MTDQHVESCGWWTNGHCDCRTFTRAEVRALMERQREACAQAALAWSRSHAEVAEDKERDSVMASAEMHMEESIMAKRIAAAIQRAPLVTEQP